MQRLINRLMGCLADAFGWRRALIVVQDETGAVAWSVTPTDMGLAVRVNTDDSLSVTLGHRDPGDAFLAELETLLESRAANQGAQGARTGSQSEGAAAPTAARCYRGKRCSFMPPQGVGAGGRRSRHDEEAKNEPRSDRRSAPAFPAHHFLACVVGSFQDPKLLCRAASGALAPTRFPSRRHKTHYDVQPRVKWEISVKSAKGAIEKLPIRLST